MIFPGVAASNTDIAGHRDLQTPADGVAVQGGDHQFRRLFQPQQRLVGMEAEIIFEARSHGIEHADLCARTEELFALAANDDHMHIIVEARL